MFVHVYTFEKRVLSGLHGLKRHKNIMSTLVCLVIILMSCWTKKEKKIMAHLFKQMYVDEIDIVYGDGLS